MRIVVVNTQVPFVRGGAELLAEALRDKLVEHGHHADLVRIPFRWYPPEHILEHVLAARLTSFHSVDRVIAFKFPAYCIPHESKVVWLLHQFRQAYDLWGTKHQDLPSTQEGLRIRDAIISMDNTSLREAKRIFTNSRVTSERLWHGNQVESTVLHPPLWDTSGYRCEPAADYVFAPSRITDLKRQDLLVESMAYVRSDIRLLLVGTPENGEMLDRIKRLIKTRRIADRVELITRWISEKEKKDFFARAVACAYIPYDEDSYGYVTLESYQSRKPVVTCADSGGTLEVVEDEHTGYVVPPDPEAIAEALDRLRSDPSNAAGLGEAGYERIRELRISWATVIESLVG